MAYVNGCSQGEAAKALAAKLGVETDETTARAVPNEWTPIVPVPANAHELTDAHLRVVAPEDYAFTEKYHYRSATGDLLGVIARYDRHANGKPASKEFRPFSYCQATGRAASWRCQGFVAPRPLYGLNRLAKRPAAPVLVVEGERTTKHAAALFPSYVVITSPNGSKSARKADWSVLSGRDVIIWPDADEPGRRYAADVADMLKAAAAKSVRIVDLPPGLPLGWDLANSLPPDIDINEVLIKSVSPPASDDPWLSPDKSVLGTGSRPAPELPLEWLGEFWAPWVARRAAAASAPADFVALSLLTCVGAALSNVRWPLAGSSWEEPPVLWCALVGSPSSGKSPGMDAAFDLLRHAEAEMAEGFDQVVRDFETNKQTAKARREGWEADVKAAVKTGEMVPPLPQDAEVPDEPVRPRIRVADSTTERLATLAASLPRGLLINRDELAGWLGSFDRYGGAGSDRAFAIESYGGRDYVVDRMKSPEPVRIRHLSIGVLGGVQPDKLATIVDSPDDGLASRLLWVWPDNIPDFSLARHITDEAAARSAFSCLTHLHMGADQFGHPEPRRVRLDKEAEGILEEFGRDMQRRSHEASGLYAGALGKARGHALRLACIAEFLWWAPRGGAEPEAITASAMTFAVGLLDAYLLPMAERVYGNAKIPLADRNAMALARYLRRQHLKTFNAREVRRDVGGVLRDHKAMDAACEALVDAGIIRPVSPPGSKGRPAKNFTVNPKIWELT